MAFQLERDVSFDLAETWRGPVSVLEFSFSFVFPSGIFGGSAVDELENLVKFGLWSAKVTPGIRDNYLGYTIERDTTPRIDRYQVKVFLAGETDEAKGEIGPFFTGGFAQREPHAFMVPALLVIVIAIGIAGVFAVIAYRIYNLGEKKLIGLSRGIVAVVAGLGFLFLCRRKGAGSSG